MTLSSLIASTDVVSVQGSRNGNVDALCFDSRKAGPASVFFALPGLKADGRRFAEDAVERGASVIVTQAPIASLDVTQIIVTDARAAMADMASAFFGRPSRQMKVFAVTGTNGKTTSAFLVQHLCESSNTPCGLLGTIQYRIGSEVIDAPHTTPESVELQGLLRRMRDAGCDAVAMEASSHALAQRRVRGMLLDAAIFTNLTQDHLDYHGSMDAYFEAKALLFEGLASQEGKRGKAILNGDERYGSRLQDRFGKRVPVVTYGVGNGCDFRASNIQASQTGTTFQLDAQGRQHLVRLPLIGRFNVMNTLGALAAVVSNGLDLRGCVQALAEAPQVPGRLQRIPVKRSFQVFVDYAHTPDALENVLRTLRDLRPRRIITVFGCGGDRDRAKRPMMARAVEALSDFAILTSDNPRSEDPQRILRDVETGLRGDSHTTVEDRRDAIFEAVRLAGSGDVVLIAGKGHEDYQELATGRIAFSDVAVATEAVKRKPVEGEP